MTAGRGHCSDQGEMWDGIAAKARRMDSDSPTAAMEAVYLRHDSTLDGYLHAIGPADGQVGAVFSIGGRVVCMDLFDQPATIALNDERDRADGAFTRASARARKRA